MCYCNLGTLRREETRKEHLLQRHQVNPDPAIIHSVDVTFNAVATPLAASVRLPVVPSGARRMVSVVMAMVITPPLS